MKKLSLLACCLLTAFLLHAEDGYRLWLRYEKVEQPALQQQYRQLLRHAFFNTSSPTIDAARSELQLAIPLLLGSPLKVQNRAEAASLWILTPGMTGLSASLSDLIKQPGIRADEKQLGTEGFHIRQVRIRQKPVILLTANTDIGALYGVFHLLRLVQTRQSLLQLDYQSVPKIKLRILNHWDNLNRSVERGYAGLSIWNWHELPGYIDQRYTDYARANASIGINGTVLTNVNANALVLTNSYLEKVAALARVFRPWGIRVYLTARFSAPVEIGGLKTADPLNEQVREWWKKKADTIYQYIPDFGGFLVKANSEGQPGPQTYGRNHADGANMLADAVAPHGGIVMWRAFVYSNETPTDRVMQAYDEFKPLDGQFRNNVMVQVKNGALDFQPREPFHPLFGAMPRTPLLMEFQITMEYLGQGTHLVYEAPLFKEVLEADTWSKGKGSTVARVIDGSLDQHRLSGIAGVANIGNERNWTNHPFGQANWYAFGRLAWDYSNSPDQIAEEWIRQSFTNEQQTVATIRRMMLQSRQTMVDYMTPLGLHHIMGTGHHYGPAPWVSNAGRADWNPVYYHRADSLGLGFNRTASGSNALKQYSPEAAAAWSDPATCDENYLLWFHHLPWNFRLSSGRSLWVELCERYNRGVDSVRAMQRGWAKLSNHIDGERFRQVAMFLAVQENDARWWRDACLLYFQAYSRLPIPAHIEPAAHSLEYYKNLRFPYAPGNGGNQ